MISGGKLLTKNYLKFFTMSVYRKFYYVHFYLCYFTRLKKTIVLPHGNHPQKTKLKDLFSASSRAFDFRNIYSNYMIPIEDYFIQLYLSKIHFWT